MNYHIILEGSLPQLTVLSACVPPALHHANSPAPLSVPDLTQTIFPRRATMTCTCEGLKNVTSQPFLHSPGAATTGPISNRVLAGWGQGTLPMFLQDGWDCLPTPCQSQGTCCSSPPGCI